MLTDHPERRFAVGAVLRLEGSDRVLTVRQAEPVADGPGWWLRFEEVGDRTAAEELRDTYLEADVAPDDREPGTWRWHEIEGLAVRSTDGRTVGTVIEVYRAGGAEVFVVRGPDGELDVPAVRGVVTELAPERGEVIVDLATLDLDARPVEGDDYVRPRDRRPGRRRPRSTRRPPASDAPTAGTDGP